MHAYRNNLYTYTHIYTCIFHVDVCMHYMHMYTHTHTCQYVATSLDGASINSWIWDLDFVHFTCTVSQDKLSNKWTLVCSSVKKGRK